MLQCFVSTLRCLLFRIFIKSYSFILPFVRFETGNSNNALNHPNLITFHSLQQCISWHSYSQLMPSTFIDESKNIEIINHMMVHRKSAHTHSHRLCFFHIWAMTYCITRIRIPFIEMYYRICMMWIPFSLFAKCVCKCNFAFWWWTSFEEELYRFLEPKSSILWNSNQTTDGNSCYCCCCSNFIHFVMSYSIWIIHRKSICNRVSSLSYTHLHNLPVYTFDLICI